MKRVELEQEISKEDKPFFNFGVKKLSNLPAQAGEKNLAIIGVNEKNEPEIIYLGSEAFDVRYPQANCATVGYQRRNHKKGISCAYYSIIHDPHKDNGGEFTFEKIN